MCEYSDFGKTIFISTADFQKLATIMFSFPTVTQNFTATPEPSHVLFGEGTFFKCVSEGRPKPEVIWKMNLQSMGGPLTIDESLKHQYEVLPDNSLHVKAATFADEGRFYCISKQPGLVVNVSAPLTVFGK